LLAGDGVREALEITTLMEQDTVTDLRHWQQAGRDTIVQRQGVHHEVG
jgi:hypothetical protein